MRFFESHAHLYFDDFDKDRDKLIENLLFSSIEGIVNVGVDLHTSKQSIKLSDKYKNVYAACGFHPNDLQLIKFEDMNILRELLSHEKVVAIGETGIDLFRDRVPLEIQRKFFIKQLEIALEENYPVIIHSRAAEFETLDIINEVSDKYSGVFHCYAGGIDTAFKLIDKGFYISFTGSITYKNNDREEVVKEIPLEYMLLETDSPFLTPIPNRGKRNDPSNLRFIAQKIAEIKNISVEEVAMVTTENSKKLFRI
ncbi:MAG: TatD family hydrolase [Candidatus Delongbacteria bacterium]|nr:TatD family hydrolase [Candidatus Delongbacteria bacterium]MCG2759811.1 TatD family hydrolase [Candidatus Delongbacteria bacterium]